VNCTSAIAFPKSIEPAAPPAAGAAAAPSSAAGVVVSVSREDLAGKASARSLSTVDQEMWVAIAVANSSVRLSWRVSSSP
jgi:hypothetical protein